MKYSIYERVYVSGDAAAVQQKIDELRNKGWKGLRYCPNNRDCDCSPSEIEGYRPMSKVEIRSCERREIREREKELSEVRKLASKHGFRLVKEKRHVGAGKTSC